MGDDNFIVYNKDEMTDFFSKVLQLNDRIKCVYTTKSKQDIYRPAEVIKISNKTITIISGGKERILKKEHITELDKIETEEEIEKKLQAVQYEERKEKVVKWIRKNKKDELECEKRRLEELKKNLAEKVLQISKEDIEKTDDDLIGDRYDVNAIYENIVKKFNGRF